MPKKNSKSDGYDYFQIMDKEGLVDIPHNPKVDLQYKPNEVDNKKKKYRYLGPVYRYDKLIIEKYNVTTLAVSEAQAVNNILYRVKHYLGYPANCGGIKLKGPIFIEED